MSHLRFLACQLVIFFLIISIISRAFGSSNAEVGSKHYALSKAAVPQAELQTPFEVKEEENGQDDPTTGTHFIPVDDTSVFFLRSIDQSFGLVDSPEHGANIPIYLAKRAILI